MGVSNEILSVSNENMGVSDDSFESPMKSKGSPMTRSGYLMKTRRSQKKILKSNKKYGHLRSEKNLGCQKKLNEFSIIRFVAIVAKTYLESYIKSSIKITGSLIVP